MSDVENPLGLIGSVFGAERPMFHKKNQLLADAATDTLEEEQPMTLRQLYYRLISAGHLDSTVKEYNRLKSVMGRMRELRHIPFSWIRDSLRQTLKPSSWSGLADFGEAVRHSYRKDFWASQDTHVEIIIEKDAVASTLQEITEQYDIRLRVCRGYASISYAAEIAELWGRVEKPIHAYYFGDFDASGFDIERDLRDKLVRYGAGEFEWERLGVVPEDFGLFDVIPLAVKLSDRRAAKFIAAHGTNCAELDAIPPTELRRRVEVAITSHIEPDEWERLQRIEDVERETMQTVVDGWGKLNLDKDSDSEAVSA